MLDGKDESFRRAFIARALFLGCLTGRRLKTAFGDLCAEIIWEESSREIGGRASFAPVPCPEHIRSVICEVQPDFILCFGRAHKDEVELVSKQCGIHRGAVIYMPHPAARHSRVVQDLCDGAARLKADIKFMHAYAASLTPEFELK